MKYLKNCVILFIVLLAMIFPINVFARPGCCSWHGGESGCSGNRTVCADGTISSCPCDGTSSSYDSSTNSSYDSNDDSDDSGGISKFTVLLILVGGFILFVYINDWLEKSKEKKAKREEERKQLELQKIEEQKIERAQDLKRCIINGENIKILLQNVDSQILNRLTSVDIVEIINANILSKTDIQLFVNKLIEANGYYSSVFNEICEYLSSANISVQQEKVYNYQRFVLEYIFKSVDDDYQKIFMKLLKNKETTFLKKILQEKLKCKFVFSYEETIDLYNALCNINDLDLVKLISTSENVEYNLEYSYDSILENNLKTKNYKNLKIYCALFQQNIYFDQYSVLSIFKMLVKFRNLDLVKFFLNECNDINTFLQKYGANLIYISIRKIWINIIEYVLENYKNINLNVIIDGGTPLIYACYKRSYRIVKAMLDYGVDVNFIDSAGNYALVCACESKNLKICKILVEHGATLFSDYQNEELEKAIKKRDVYRLPSVYINDIYNKRRKSNY